MDQAPKNICKVCRENPVTKCPVCEVCLDAALLTKQSHTSPDGNICTTCVIESLWCEECGCRYPPCWLKVQDDKSLCPNCYKDNEDVKVDMVMISCSECGVKVGYNNTDLKNRCKKCADLYHIPGQHYCWCNDTYSIPMDGGVTTDADGSVVCRCKTHL